MSSYIDMSGREGRDDGHRWADFTNQRLQWLYGFERAYMIRAGRDAATNVDVAAWNALGRRAAA